MRPTSYGPVARSLGKVTGVMGEEHAMFPRGNGQLAFIGLPQIASLANGETVHTMLSKHVGQHDRDGFVQIELHRRPSARRPGSRASCSAIS